MNTAKRRKTTAEANRRVEAPVGGLALRQRVAEKAYELFLKRGREHGHDMEDWLEAERIVSAQERSRSRSEAAASGREALHFPSPRPRSL